MTEADQPTATVTPAKDGRGGFFAVDRRIWHFVAGLGLNPAIAHLVMVSTFLLTAILGGL